MKLKRKLPSESTERAVNKIVEEEFKLEKRLKELIRLKREIYKRDFLLGTNDYPKVRVSKDTGG